MYKQNKKQIKISQNIKWRKWENKKRQYEQQRILNQQLKEDKISSQVRSSSLFNNNNGNLQKYQAGLIAQTIKRKSYQQFLTGVGYQNIFDLNWLMVGQPNAFYVSDRRPIKQNIIKRIKTQSNEGKLLSITKKVSRSGIWSRLKTQPPRVIAQRQISKNLKLYSRSSGFTQAKTIKTEYKTAKKSRKDSHQFECRPWSRADRAEKQSLVDFCHFK